MKEAIPSISSSALRCLENLVTYYKNLENFDLDMEESSDEVG